MKPLINTVCVTQDEYGEYKLLSQNYFEQVSGILSHTARKFEKLFCI